MIHIGKIKAAAELAATDVLAAGAVEEVRVEPAVGSEGQDILRVTIVLAEPVAMRDDDFVDVLLSVKKGIRETGEERQAVIQYATQAELDDDGDPES